ncbi:MAG: IPT/TIG domain-containing protein [Anaerolineae bacterium]|nr:IPT/TIG domain-containing protein [Gemmatimonadaceae bacterium]
MRKVILLGLLAAAACGGGDGGGGGPVKPVAVDNVVLSHGSANLVVGDSIRVSATPRDASGNAISGRSVSWTTSNAAVVRVSAIGWVIGVAAGSATITATADGKSNTLSVNVSPPSSGPFVSSASSPLLTPGASILLIGQNFGDTPSQNLVTIDGVNATVTAASATQLTVNLPAVSSFPCEATHNANVVVKVGSQSGTLLVPLQVATQRSLTLGQSLVLLNQSEVRCNELAQSGGRYMVSVFNTSTSISSTPSLQLRGSASTALNAKAIPPVAGAVASRSNQSSGASFVSNELQIRKNTGRAHRRALEEDRAIFRRGASAARARRSQSSGAPSLSLGRPSLNLNTVGDTTTMKIPNRELSDFCTSAPISVRARTVYSGARAIILEDVAAPLAGTMDSYYQQIGQEFDQVMFPIVTANFGNPLAYDGQTDKNGKIIMLFSKQVNDFGGILGFVTTCDLFDPTFKFSDNTSPIASNYAEIFYAVAPTSAATGFASTIQSMTKDGWRRLIRGTVIHEVKHLAMFAERFAHPTADVLEESWLEEGTAMLSEELFARTITGATRTGNTGYGTSANPTGLFCEVRPGSSACPADRPSLVFPAVAWLHDYLRRNEELTMLGSSPSVEDDATFYGTSWAFVRWVLDHHFTDDATFLKALVAEPHLTGVDNVVARVNRPYAELLADFSLAVALDDRAGFTASRTQFSFLSWNLSALFQGLNTDYSNNNPNPFPLSHPLQPRRVGFGSFVSEVSALRGGTAAFFEISGAQTSKQLVELRSLAGGNPSPTLRIAIVRVQ